MIKRGKQRQDLESKVEKDHHPLKNKDQNLNRSKKPNKNQSLSRNQNQNQSRSPNHSQGLLQNQRVRKSNHQLKNQEQGKTVRTKRKSQSLFLMMKMEAINILKSKLKNYNKNSSLRKQKFLTKNLSLLKKIKKKKLKAPKV